MRNTPGAHGNLLPARPPGSRRRGRGDGTGSGAERSGPERPRPRRAALQSPSSRAPQEESARAGGRWRRLGLGGGELARPREG